jgi:hypothetical protein
MDEFFLSRSATLATSNAIRSAPPKSLQESILHFLDRLSMSWRRCICLTYAANTQAVTSKATAPRDSAATHAYSASVPRGWLGRLPIT